MSDTVQVLADDNPLAVDASRYHLIDDKTRALTQPEDENEKILGVETDKDAVRRYFKCPKIVGDNIDLSQCQLYVGYIGAKDEKGKLFLDEEPGRYHCDDVSEDGDYLLFSWKLSGNVFLRDGYVAYNIYAVSNNGDEAEMVWNTTPAIGKVLRTVPKGTDIVERFPDVINQLFERLLALEAKIGNGGGTSFSGSAADVTYDNTNSGLDADNAQDAIDKLSEEIANLSKGMDLSTLTMTVTAVDGGNRLTLSDGTTEKYVDIPSVSITDEQIESLVNAWLDENGVQAGATTEQAEQIEKNKTEIESIRESLFDVQSGYGSANIFDNDFSKSGYYVDGVYKTSANFKCTPTPVPINKVVDTLYAIMTVSASPLAMQFLDENGAYLNGATLSNQTAMTITVPIGATSFVMYVSNAWEGKVCISYEQLSEYVEYVGFVHTYIPKKTESDKSLTVDGGFADAKVTGEKLAEVEQKANDVSSIITEETSGNLFDGTWVDGWFSDADGVDNPNVKNNVITPYIPFELSDVYSNSFNVKTTVASQRLTYALYDAEKVFVKAEYFTIEEFSICNLPKRGFIRFKRPNTEEFELYVSQEVFATYEQLKEKKVDEKNLSTELQNTIQLLGDVNIIEKPNGNIFDNEYGSLGYIVDGVDTFNKNNNQFKRTAKYYPFKKGVLYFRTQSNINPLSVQLYDKDKNYVETLPFANVTTKDTFLEYDGYFRLYVPLANETLIYISNDKPSDEVDYEYHGTIPCIEQESEYANDICVCFGDSIMAGNANEPWTSIPYLLGQKSGMQTYNVGFGGTRMSDRGTETEASKAFNAYSFCHLVEAVISQDYSSQEEALSNSEVANMYYFDEHLATLKSIDFSKVTRVTIAYGTNDYTGMNDISNNEDDLDISTVCGALKYSIKKLQEAFPHLKILVITPIWGYYEIATGKSGDNIDYGKGTLPAYVEAIMETSKELKIPCLDAYYQLGFNFYNCEYYFNGGNDNVHLNEKGRERYAELIYGKWRSIY